MTVPAACLLSLLVAMPAQAQSMPSRPDFDGAMRGLGFDPVRTDANLDTSEKGNGIPDADEMALVAAVLANPALDLRASGGVHHQAVRAAFDQALASATADIAPLRDRPRRAASGPCPRAAHGRRSVRRGPRARRAASTCRRRTRR